MRTASSCAVTSPVTILLLPVIWNRHVSVNMSPSIYLPIFPTTVIVFAVLLRVVSIQSFLATGVECSSFRKRLLSPAAVECPSTPAASRVIMAVSLSVLIVIIEAVIVFIYKQNISSVSTLAAIYSLG